MSFNAKFLFVLFADQFISYFVKKIVQHQKKVINFFPLKEKEKEKEENRSKFELSCLISKSEYNNE